MTIRQLSIVDFDAALPGLAAVLADVVAGGASVGFRLPFGPEEALAWWRTRRDAVADGTLQVWVADNDDRIVGTISLALVTKPNGVHRAEIVKVMVHRDARGRGLGRALLAAAEQSAAEQGLTLLLLDTVTGSDAERLYEKAGWTRLGVVPGYAADPDGKLEASTFFYKDVDFRGLRQARPVS